jgi:ribonuclease T1
MALPSRNNSHFQRQIIRLGVFALILIVAWLAKREPEQKPIPPVAPPAQKDRANFPAPSAQAKKCAEAPAEAEADGPSDNSLVVRNLALRDEDGNVVYRGDIELKPTLERIAANRKLRFSHDGSDFENRERGLPRKPSGYYREWVVPTPGERGPGPQRLVVGEDGDVWYTPDHYRNFRRIPYQFP